MPGEVRRIPVGSGWSNKCVRRSAERRAAGGVFPVSGPELVLLVILVLGLAGRSGVLVGAAALLLLLHALRLTRLVGVIEGRALELGLVFLMVSVLSPFARGEVGARQLVQTIVSVPGALAVLAAVLATRLNLGGLELLEREPSLMVGIVVGSILGVVFAKGIPVGPLMAAGLAWVFICLWQRLFG